MQIRHNTALLEQAVDLLVKRSAIPTLQAEAEANERSSRATAIRRLATGSAIAVAALGIGLGIFLGTPNNRKDTEALTVAAPDHASPLPTEKQEERLPANESVAEQGKPDGSAPVDDQDSAAALPKVPAAVHEAEPEPPREVVTVDFTKFANKTVQVFGRDWNLETGHYFADEKDESWNQSWCYTRQSVAGVTVTIDLARRASPDAPPVAPVSPAETLSTVGLSDQDAVELASKCAWLDNAVFRPGDFALDPSRALAPEPAEPEVPEFLVRDGWDAIGHDLPDMPIRNVSLDWCQSACQGNTQCIALTYNKAAEACFLKGDASVMISNKEATTVARSVVENNLTYSDLVFASATKLVGTIYARKQQIRYPDCIIECAKSRKCKGFNFQRKLMLCQLYGAVISSDSHGDFLSGLKQAR